MISYTRHHDVKGAFEESLRCLGLDYIDMYLIHWPITAIMGDGPLRVLQPDEHPNFIDVWKEMELLLETGKFICIAASNYHKSLLTHV